MSNQSEYGEYRDRVKGHPGINLGRTIQAVAVGRGDLLKAVAFAEAHIKGSWLPDYLTKAAVAAGTTSDAVWAGPLALPQPLSAELTRLLYPQDVISQLLARGARRVPFLVSWPRVNVGATSSWVAAGGPVPISASSLDSVSLGVYKTSGIQVLSQELARSQFIDVAATLAADMVQSLAAFRNKSAMDPDNAGIVGEKPASLTFGSPQFVSSGLTIADFVNDAGLLMNSLSNNGIPLGGAVWIMSEKLGGYLSRLRSTTGTAAFPGISALGGEWFGVPALTSGSEIESHSPTEQFATLCDVQSIAIAQDDTPLIDSAKSASLQLLDNPTPGATSLVSLWQMGLVAVRATMHSNFIARRPVAVATLRGINI